MPPKAAKRASRAARGGRGRGGRRGGAAPPVVPPPPSESVEESPSPSLPRSEEPETPMRNPVLDRLVAPAVVSSPIAARSAAAPAVLSCPCCWRCSKNLHELGADDCNAGVENCWRCKANRHPCNDVPAADIPVVNTLLARRAFLQGYNGGNKDRLVLEFQKAVKAYTKKSELTKKKKDKEGGTSKPKDALAVGVLLLGELRTMNQLIANGVDSYRSVHGLPALGREEGVARTEPATWRNTDLVDEEDLLNDEVSSVSGSEMSVDE